MADHAEVVGDAGDEVLVLGAGGHDGQGAGAHGGDGGDRGHGVGWVAVGVVGAQVPGEGLL